METKIIPYFCFWIKWCWRVNSMKKTSSMSKDSSNLSKPRFGCYFPCNLVNFKNVFFFFFFFFWNIWDIWKRQSSCFQIMQTWKYKTSIISMNWIEIFIKSYSLVHKKKKVFLFVLESGFRHKMQNSGGFEDWYHLP